MAIKQLSYQDIPQEHRTLYGAQMVNQLQAKLVDPLLTQPQRAQLEAQLTKIKKWMDGTL